MQAAMKANAAAKRYPVDGFEPLLEYMGVPVGVTKGGTVVSGLEVGTEESDEVSHAQGTTVVIVVNLEHLLVVAREVVGDA